jgi:formate--tetrahydrofolate ligase
MGMTFSDYTVTEAGFGCDLGAEKFLDIKCQSAGFAPKAVVLTTTIRALKYHGGADLKELTTPNVEALQRGLPNLEKHLENVGQFNLVPVVAINKFVSDTDEEVATLVSAVENLGYTVAVADVWAKGGEGAIDLARKVVEAVESGKSDFKPLYQWEDSVKSKIETLAIQYYGAGRVEYAAKAKADLRRITKLGLEGLPICMAKTQKSLSDNPALLGRPTGFTITVREIEVAAGAGFLIPITGDMMRMPGLPAVPASENIDIDEDGNISGLM